MPCLPGGGYSWETEWILPVLALSLRPMVQIARVTGGLLSDELGARYVTAALSAEGKLLWRVNLQQSKSKALSGAVVASDGIACYPTGASLLAVDAQGGLRWRINLPTYSIINPLPRLSRDERFLFFQEFVIDAQTSEMLFSQTPGPMGLLFCRCGWAHLPVFFRGHSVGRLALAVLNPLPFFVRPLSLLVYYNQFRNG